MPRDYKRTTDRQSWSTESMKKAAHPGRVVTHLQIAGLFNEAYGKAATVQNACHGFKSTGIWPLNPDIFPDYMYEPAETTNMPLEDNSNEEPTQPATVMSSVESEQVLVQPSQQADDSVPVINTSQVAVVAALPLVQPWSHDTISEENNAAEITVLTDPQAENSSQVPTTSSGLEVFLTAAATNERPSSFALAVPIEVLSPVPKGCFISGQGKRKPKIRQSSLVLTCTPNMLEIKSKNEPKAPATKKKRKATKKLFEENDEEEDFPSIFHDDEEDCACIYCNDLYSRSKPGEGWLQCLQCSLWAHASCADVPRRTKRFICELCQ
ncbi:uncharacterized protein ACR2FA_002014 [Aphomia sociella]